MARLSDIPRIHRSCGLVAFCLRVWDETGRDSLFVWASALAYSWLFAIFPFFIFLLALNTYLPAQMRQSGTAQIQRLIAESLPSAANGLMWRELDNNPNNLLHRKNVRRSALVFGLLFALWAASGGASMTMAALDRCYELEKGRPYILHRLVALGLTVVVAAILLAVFALIPIAAVFKPAAIQLVPGLSPMLRLIFNLGRGALSLALMLIVLAIVYHCGPAIRHRFSPITPGAVFVILVWLITGVLFRVYIERMGARGYASTYGTVAGVAILLLFFYVDAVVLLIGAEINSEVDFEVLRVRRGTRDFRHAEDLSNAAPTGC